MRNWGFQLVEQLVRSNWAILPSAALSAGAQLEMIINSSKDIKAEHDLIKARGNYEFSAIQINGSSFSETDSFPDYDKLQKGSIALFKMSGTMLKYGTLCSYGTEEIAAQMIHAANHKNIGGALLISDSGGGGVNSIAPVRDALLKFEQMGKPTVDLVDSCYSASYFKACYASHIMAANNISAGAGSIGVVASFQDVRPYYEQMGYKFHTIYAPESEEKNAAVEEALKGNYDKIKNEELSPMAQMFQAIVKDRRAGKLDLADESILKGKTYNAEQSLANGLIDSIGNFDAAIDMLQALMAAQQFVNNK